MKESDVQKSNSPRARALTAALIVLTALQKGVANTHSSKNLLEFLELAEISPKDVGCSTTQLRRLQRACNKHAAPALLTRARDEENLEFAYELIEELRVMMANRTVTSKDLGYPSENELRRIEHDSRVRAAKNLYEALQITFEAGWYYVDDNPDKPSINDLFEKIVYQLEEAECSCLDALGIGRSELDIILLISEGRVRRHLFTLCEPLEPDEGPPEPVYSDFVLN